MAPPADADPGHTFLGRGLPPKLRYRTALRIEDVPAERMADKGFWALLLSQWMKPNDPNLMSEYNRVEARLCHSLFAFCVSICVWNEWMCVFVHCVRMCVGKLQKGNPKKIEAGFFGIFFIWAKGSLWCEYTINLLITEPFEII